ncbi:nicotinamide phosphoribosyltransferase domain-containing protein [Paenibacillus sp. NEAU-GSW1]|uniref:nicotinamide phosphoribosyltransferase domain-containing protein n=1 Tax=Paenibacillus sp. NEAU-GSW1 TaxID=2682486 RepID=UPI0012E1E683|nr:nicotinamide phosphoribosyltransferase domain-containing protein [Paenibacillus sp. NEAU-GSW1]MUT65841.1 nicotinate phosphoribosyltransferase [Paenibacillus sp. NEAU-GSW1]
MLNAIRNNPLLLTDSYNLSHYRLKCNMDWEISHMYNRKEGMILYGLREIATELLAIRITEEHVREAEQCADMQGLQFPAELFLKVVRECDGYAPIAIESLPEGTWCPAGTPFAQVRNTVEGFGELVTWWEGVLMHAYFPSACATEAFRLREYLERKRQEQGEGEGFYWRLHSFGFRGHRSLEDAYWAGTAWNLSLQGTDDFHTTLHTPGAVIGSIAALAHKVTQQYDDELACFRHAIDATADAGEKIVALVIDTYDAYRVIREYLPQLALQARERGIRIVLRPDSGDVLAQAIEIYRTAKKGGFQNETAVIIGEGMSFEQVQNYDAELERQGVPLAFVSYGIGSGFYQHLNRDTYGWAMKTAYSNGKERMKFSMEPLKRSIPGEVKITNINGRLVAMAAEEAKAAGEQGLYETIYTHDGIGMPQLLKAGPAHWMEVRGRVQAAIGQTEAKQKAIELSEGIQNRIEAIAQQYL